MSLVNHSVNSLIQGVSEQAPSVRLDNQLEEQVNCFSDVTRGLTKRNGLELKEITQLDIEGTFKIPFTVDGVKHMIALDANNAITPLQYVPLSVDVDALAVSITESQYFKEMSRGDLQIIEDKEKVYLLNRRQIVGDGNSRATYFDIKLIRQDNFTTPTTWTDGEYTLTLDGVADPDFLPLNVAVGQVVVTVDRTTTLQDIADDINGDVDFIAESGPCTVSGTISNYRIKFAAIPSGYIFPTVLELETVAITEAYDFSTDTGWIFNASVDEVRRTRANFQGDVPPPWSYEWRSGGVVISTTSSSTYSDGTSTYYRGAYHFDGGNYEDYFIKKVTPNQGLRQYDLESTSPSTTQTGAAGIAYADRAMVWVTGVTSSQTYDVTVNYYDITAPETNIPVSIATVSVGTIQINWVAGQIQSKVNALGNLTATQYDNTVLISSDSGYGISSVEVTNNFDNSSIHSVVEAVESNESGIADISTLPPVFIDDFKLRVGSDDSDKTNYYLIYSTSFRGWKEGGLNESRFLDRTTLPYIIDKEKIKETGIVTIEPATWEQLQAGDVESNKDPSFVGRTINDMFFYGSRLGFATDDTLVMSAIDDHDTFFRTTTSQTKVSDRKDIKLDSSKIGYDPIKHVITFDGKLFINTGSNQSMLLVNTNFDLTSARLSEVSSYSLGDNKPIPVGNGLYFANTTKGNTNVYNYVPVGNNAFEAIEMTKHCPRYLKGDFKDMAYSSDVTVVSTFDDNKTLFVQNRFSQGGQMVQNAWHKWTLPFDVEHFYFQNNTLFVIMSSLDSGAVDTYTIVTQYDLKPQDVEETNEDIYIGWTPILDCYTKDKTLIENFSEFQGVNDLKGISFPTVTEAYDSTSVTQVDEGVKVGPFLSKVSVKYYWKVDGNLNIVVFNDGTEILFGNTTLLTYDIGGFRYYKGDTDDGTGHFEVAQAPITTSQYNLDEMLYGVPFTSTIELSPIVSRKEGANGFVIMNYANLMLRRMRLLLDRSGLFNVTIGFKDRPNYVSKFTGAPLGQLVIGRSTVSDINFNFPIHGKSDKITITIETQDSSPFNLLSTEWQGQLITKGRNI